MPVRTFILVLIIFASTFALYQPSWQNQFVLDDMTKIQENTDLRGPFKIQNFIYPYAEGQMHFRNDPSRPLTYILYWTCWHIGDGQVWPFHVLNTVAHATTAALLAILTLQLSFFFFGEQSFAAAGLAAGLFITSPLMAGTVAYPFGLSDILCALFCLAMLVSLVETQTPSRLRMICAVTLYYLALSSKQAGFVAPALVIAVDYYTGKAKNPWRMLHIYTPLLSMSAIYLIVRFLYFGGVGDLEGAGQTLQPLTYFSTQGLMILKYLWHSFVPVGLSIDHQYYPDNMPLWPRWLAWALIAVISGFALRTRWSRSRRNKILAFAWSFFLICLLPTSSILPTVDLYVERRAYFADLGIFLAAGILIWRISRRGKWKIPALLAASFALSAQAAITRQRLQVYGDPEKLWNESLTLEPQNTRAMINLAVYYSKIQKWEESRVLLEELSKLRPDNGTIYSKLAYIFHQPTYAGRNDELAWQMYKKSLETNPENIFALYNAGLFLMEQGQNREAIDYFLRAVKLSPQMTQSLVAAGQAAWNMGDKESARIFFNDALKIDPNLERAKKYLNR